VAHSVEETGPASVEALRRLITRLRGENGCPWDRKQTPSSLSIYAVEEMYELADAITSDNSDAILEELGDVLFQIFFISHLFEEMGRFAFDQVIERIIAKMIHRHPHVFGSEKAETSRQVKQRWRQIKQQEKGDAHSLLDSIPATMSALMRAYRVSERAAGTGFDWDSLQGVLRQAEQEWDEFKAEIGQGVTSETEKDKAAMELGDVLFTLVNVARIAGIHPETALSRSTQKFIGRFKHMEAMAAERHTSLDALPRDEMEGLWQAAKMAEPPHE
jgi:MazG family protein